MSRVPARGWVVDRPNGKSPTRGNVAGFVREVLARAVRRRGAEKKEQPAQ